MYYRLDMDKSAENAFFERASHMRVQITEGVRLPDDTPTPFEYSLEIEEDEEKYDEANDVIAYQKPNILPYVRNCSLMLKEMVETIVETGADNLQTFPAVVRHPETGLEINDYLFVNVIGMVACANIGESTTDRLGPSYFFHKLVLDPTKMRDFLIFRLAEYSFEVIVHERVAEALISKNFQGLVVEPLSTSAAD